MRAKTPLPFLRARGAHAEPEAAPDRSPASWLRWLDVGLAIAIGLAVLLVYDVPYMLHQSFWLDEAWLADSIRAPIGLTHSMGSSTPVGWTFLLRLIPFGGPERLRLLPLIFAMLAAVAGYLLGRELRLSRFLTGILTGAAVLLSPAMLVQADLKQYTAEAFACLLVWVLVARVENEWRIGRLAAVAAVSSVGLIFSNTVIFVGVAAMASLGLECLVTRRWWRLLQVAAASVGMLIVSLAIYVKLMRPEITKVLVTYWHAFYVPNGSWHSGWSFVYQHLVSLAPHAGFRIFTVDEVGVLAGIVALIWLRRFALAALFPFTLVAVVAASAAGKYPFGDLRTSTFWLVIPPVLMAIAVSTAGQLAGRLSRVPRLRLSWLKWLAPLVAAATALAFWVPAARPYVRSHVLPAEDVHDQVLYLDRHYRPGDVVIVNFKASYAFAYYYPATPSFPAGDGPNGHLVSYPSRPWLIVMTQGGLSPIPQAMAEARAKIAAEPVSARGRIWIITSHQRRNELVTWLELLFGQSWQSINVGPEPILLYNYQPPGPAASAHH